ncbi:nucleoside triphosphate pyrophosphohydrolase [Pseudohongiella spirulinae]|uniref:Nucleoside triphosphate pyrophosphohydrolase n=1 Tax=Pseudohongiella spirulinae TaxID=1249552 RepID=A0A0S2KE39_9GAMM|nr:nucleoside triphosphate pyrophosphohydrolase [Pseudohongiella spirulinae]ALO46242.1 nucleoside triphosphate hydrolase [Pseudohongiella spirulinae]
MNDKRRQTQSFARLVELMADLRDPEHGCAWDRKQTLESLKRHTLEEVYEVIDAIDEGDAAKIRDELGDLLFQVVFYARIAQEQKLFDIADVADGIVGKLLHRHPHIFPDGTLESFGQPSDLTAEQVEKNWELIKNAERQSRADQAFVSVMDDVPRAMPALERAGKLQKRAASLSFDWQDVDGVLAKLTEEIDELRSAISSGNARQQSHELGDVLFTCVNLARHLKLDPEGAVRDANARFENRFRFLEDRAAHQGVSVSDVPIDRLEIWWCDAKAQER